MQNRRRTWLQSNKINILAFLIIVIFTDNYCPSTSVTNFSIDIISWLVHIFYQLHNKIQIFEIAIIPVLSTYFSNWGWQNRATSCTSLKAKDTKNKRPKTRTNTFMRLGRGSFICFFPLSLATMTTSSLWTPSYSRSFSLWLDFPVDFLLLSNKRTIKINKEIKTNKFPT